MSLDAGVSLGRRVCAHRLSVRWSTVGVHQRTPGRSAHTRRTWWPRERSAARAGASLRPLPSRRSATYLFDLVANL